MGCNVFSKGNFQSHRRVSWQCMCIVYRIDQALVYNLFCNELVHVIYSAVSGQCSYTITYLYINRCSYWNCIPLKYSSVCCFNLPHGVWYQIKSDRVQLFLTFTKCTYSLCPTYGQNSILAYVKIVSQLMSKQYPSLCQNSILFCVTFKYTLCLSSTRSQS